MNEALCLPSLVPALRRQELVHDLLRNVTYVGIDFGTSTTVASYAVLGDRSKPVSSEPIPIPQKLSDGRTQSYHLVPSVIAWDGQELLVGAGAQELQSRLTQGKDVWSSFKMELGVDLGPKYYNTALAHGHSVATIETPRDAATVFFRYLKEHIEHFIKQKGLPADVRYCVSTPASFEANQRHDLMLALKAAGMELPEQAFIDEPNAAFLSYLVEANSNTNDPLHVPKDSPLHVLVFDFGAGTCDISILEIGQGSKQFYSKNLAISRFEALGGDDVDREVVRQVLLPALLKENGLIEADLRSVELEKRILPALKRTAEVLKIQTCKAVAGQMMGTHLPASATGDEAIILGESKTVDLPRRTLTLARPGMTRGEFAEVMKPLLETDSAARRRRKPGTPISIFEPVESALFKSGLKADQLDMILLIGGSSENPYVQAALHQFSPAEVEVPRDLRIHVSTGAALNSLFLNGFCVNVVRPITSEPILVVTQDKGLQTLVPAGTEIPCAPVNIQDLRVGQEGQETIEVPVCVSSENKILSVIEITSQCPDGFVRGTPVLVTCEVTADKLLKVTVSIEGQKVAVETLHPFANVALTAEESAIREAEKLANVSAAQNGGRPTLAALTRLKEACIRGGEYLRAAELAETIASLNPRHAQESHICWLYSQADNPRLTEMWAEKAYARDQNATSAFNLALQRQRAGKMREYERLMEEALRFDENHEATLVAYGSHLMRKGDMERGREMVRRAFESLHTSYQAGSLDENDHSRLATAARALGKPKLAEDVEQAHARMLESTSLYNRANLLTRDDYSPIKRHAEP